MKETDFFRVLGELWNQRKKLAESNPKDAETLLCSLRDVRRRDYDPASIDSAAWEIFASQVNEKK